MMNKKSVLAVIIGIGVIAGANGIVTNAQSNKTDISGGYTNLSDSQIDDENNDFSEYDREFLERMYDECLEEQEEYNGCGSNYRNNMMNGI